MKTKKARDVSRAFQITDYVGRLTPCQLVAEDQTDEPRAG